MAITPRIKDEISAPLKHGYSFPLKVLSRVKTVPLNKEALEEYERLQHGFTWVKESLKLSLIVRRKELCLLPTT